MRSEFEKAYEPNPHKSPFTEVRFNEEKQIYEPLNPPLDRVARSLNAAWYGYRIRQTEVDELQKRVEDLELNIKGAVTFVDLQIEATEQGREAAIGTQAKNWWSSKLLMLRPIRRVLEQALKGGDQ